MVSCHNYRSWWSIYWLTCVVVPAKVLYKCFYDVIPCRLHIKWSKHFVSLFFKCTCFFLYVFCLAPVFFLSDMMSVRVSGCAAMCIFRKCATTRCLGWRKELSTSSGFMLLTRPEQGAPPMLQSLSSLQTPWNTPGPWVTHNTLWRLTCHIKTCEMQHHRSLRNTNCWQTQPVWYSSNKLWCCLVWFESKMTLTTGLGDGHDAILEWIQKQNHD